MFGKINISSSSLSKSILSNKKPNINKKQYKNSEKQTQIHNKVNKKHKKINKKYDNNTNQKQLQGSKFRILNQMLYKTKSSEAVKYFQQNINDFQIYHNGYKHQTSKWKYRPVDQIIQYLKREKNTYKLKQPYFQIRKIVDLGCGQGFLYDGLMKQGFDRKNIQSFDLVSTKSFIKIADIANLPLKNLSVDVCVFCLSLMGTNYLSFIKQAFRVLKLNGQMIISQVQSRSPNWQMFINIIKFIGFQLKSNGFSILPKYQNQEKRFFRSFIFQKKQEQLKGSHILISGAKINIQDISKQVLLPCNYKKR